MASILKVNELKDAGGNAIITSNGSGAVTYSGVDLNGTELILDADADTSITADTDDQIDFKIGGSDIFQMTASKLDLNGVELVLDADADTSITADTDDQIDFKIAGADDFQMTANTFTVASGSKVTYGDGGSQSNLMADEWRITSDLAGDDGTIFTANWERNDTNFSLVGSGMTESSGAFTFPSTGIYLLYFRSRFQINGDLNNVKLGINMTTDNSSYTSITLASQNSQNSGVEVMSVNGAVVVDITNTTTHKVKLAYGGTTSAVTWYGSSTQMYTGITFLRLGDT